MQHTLQCNIHCTYWLPQFYRGRYRCSYVIVVLMILSSQIKTNCTVTIVSQLWTSAGRYASHTYQNIMVCFYVMSRMSLTYILNAFFKMLELILQVLDYKQYHLMVNDNAAGCYTVSRWNAIYHKQLRRKPSYQN